ncbi:MAG: NPCBM/NEW2 domain-containing protein [Planctomycetota bacterium]
MRICRGVLCLRLVVALGMAVCAFAAAAEVKVGAGDVAFAVNPATGVVTARSGDWSATGKGVLLKVSPGEDGKTVVTDLGKAKPPVDVGGGDQVVAKVPVYQGLPVTALVVWDAGGGADARAVPLAALGYPADAVLAGYDLAEDVFFGPVIDAFARRVDGGQCQVFGVAQAADRPVVLCTSRSLAGGDLVELAWDAEERVLSGVSKVAKEERYELRVFCPPQPQRWVAEAGKVSPADDKAGATIRALQTYQWLRVYLESPEPRAVRWAVKFAVKPPRPTDAEDVRFSATAVSPWRVQLACYGVQGQVVIRRNDGAEFTTDGGSVADETVEPETSYTYTAHAVSWTGRTPAVGTAKVKTPAPPPMPPKPDVWISDLQPVKATTGWGGEVRRNTSIEDNPLRIGGERFRRGMGVHAISDLVYKVKPDYERFTACIGVDDEKDSGSVTFEVFADDQRIFNSGTVRAADDRKNVDVAIPKGTKTLRLHVGDAGDGIGSDHADWARAGFVTAD